MFTIFSHKSFQTTSLSREINNVRNMQGIIRMRVANLCANMNIVYKYETYPARTVTFIMICRTLLISVAYKYSMPHISTHTFTHTKLEVQVT